MILANGSTDVTTYFVLRDSTTHAPKADVTVTDIDVYYQEQGAAQAAKADLTALAAADSAHADNKGFHCGNSVYRIDWPDAAFDGGAGKKVILIVVCSGVDTAYLEVELSPSVGAAASVTAGVTLADDAITSAKFDESTAYPLKSADTGATAVARTGADSDTLETLSDEIATMQGNVTDILTDTGTTLDTLIKDVPTVAEFEARTLAAADYVVVTDTIAGVTTVTTTTNLTNAPTNGDFTATMKSSITAAVPTAAAIADAVFDETSTGHTDAGKAGAQIWTDIDAILTDTNELQTNQGNWLTATGFSTHSAADVVTALGTGSTLTDCATATGFSTHSADDVKTAIEAEGSSLASILTDTALVEKWIKDKLVGTDNGDGTITYVLYDTNGTTPLLTWVETTATGTRAAAT